MTFGGLQKLSLLDYPDRTCATLFARGCNFRCPWCHNASLVLPGAYGPAIPQAELLAFLEKRRGLLDGVCLSGGEPLLQPDIADFLRRVKALGYAVKLDTNGAAPGPLSALLAEGLVDYVAMDIKAAPENYAAAVGLPGFDPAPVLESVRLLQGGAVPHEFRTTVVRPLHTAADFEAIGHWLKGALAYYLQGYQDSGGVVAPGMAAFSSKEMREFLDIVRRDIPTALLRGG